LAVLAFRDLRPVCAKESVVSGVSSLLKWSSAAMALSLAADSLLSPLSILEAATRASSSTRNWWTEKSAASLWLTAASRSPCSNSS